jgi:patatin-like phospholipase/acyl hydrolase
MKPEDESKLSRSERRRIKRQQRERERAEKLGQPTRAEPRPPPYVPPDEEIDENRGIIGRIYDALYGPFQARPRKLYRVLAIDGGGIRGLVPARVLEDIERRMGKPIHECFDLIVGTSTGAILAAGFACPHPDHPGKARFTASEIVQNYRDLGKVVFPPGIWQSVRQTVRRKYSSDPLRQTFERMYGKATVQDGLTGLLLLAGDTERRRHLFMRHKGPGIPNDPEDLNFRLSDAVLGAGAAPTFFEPAKVFSIPRTPGEEPRRYSLLDAAIYANNPALHGFMQAWQNKDEKSEVLVVSIGTGYSKKPYLNEDLARYMLIDWVNPSKGVPLIAMAEDSQSSSSIEMMQKALGNRFIRIEEDINSEKLPAAKRPSLSIDDASPANMGRIEAFADFVLAEQNAKIEALCDMLKDDMRTYPRQSARPPEKRRRRFLPNDDAPHPVPGGTNGAANGGTAPPGSSGNGNSNGGGGAPCFRLPPRNASLLDSSALRSPGARPLPGWTGPSPPR